MEALIIHLDTNKASGLDDLKQWDILEHECQPEVIFKKLNIVVIYYYVNYLRLNFLYPTIVIMKQRWQKLRLCLGV